MNEFVAELSRASNLAFPIEIVDGPPIITVGEAADLLSALSDESREKGHWRVAIKMLNTALREPSYLKAATLSLRTALVLDQRVGHVGTKNR